MSDQMRCLNCRHVWKIRTNSPRSVQCPQCRRYRVIDNDIFEHAVIDLVHLLRDIHDKQPLEEFSRALYHAREIVQKTFPDPLLPGQAAYELVSEALGRLGFPQPPKLPPLP